MAAGKKDAEEWQIDTPMSNSLRTTIPAYLVNQFDLKKGDKISWNIENGSVVIQVAKQENKTLRS